GKVYRFLGLTVGLVIHEVEPGARHASYLADITYGTNNEFGFDYLRDNMAIYKTEMVQRGQPFAIVDEVDSILIDEARTPLIISGQGDQSTQLYQIVDSFVSRLKCKRFTSVDAKEEEDADIDADYVVDEKAKTVTLTARGVAKAEQQFNLANLADMENTTLSHHINQAIRAWGLMKRDIDYVVKDGEVLIVDEFTGRIMYGRRYSEGLHQAIEAKEKVEVARESKTLATITFQNYFRLYGKLSGMTGTALTEEDEFNEIYKLDIVEIPTNRPLGRKDNPDVVYKNQPGKLRAVVAQIEACHEKGQPVLVGTVSIEKSEQLSAMLTRAGVKHNVLNAKNHEKEAEIIAQAGKFGAVTVATNMAGRGTDIMLGGNAEFLAKTELKKAGLSDELIVESTGFAETDDEEILNARKLFAAAEAKYKEEIKTEAERVCSVGGLFILGTERHESRRIDNQLRGRAGRQGDPGESRFFLSLEDDIMRLFGSERVMGMMEKLGVDEDTPIEQKMLSNAIENAQKQVESRNFQTRKTVLEYDDVMNVQREVIYKQRRQVLDGEDLKNSVQTMIATVIEGTIASHMGDQKHMNAEEFRAATATFRGVFLTEGDLKLTDAELEKYDAAGLVSMLSEKATEIYTRKEQELGEPLMRELERVMMLRVVDEYWMENIDAMQELRQGIGLRAYGQTDPVVAYKSEGYDMFENMIGAIQDETVRRIFLARVQVGGEVKRQRVAKVTGESGGDDGTVKKQPVKKTGKPGRNDPCPCGSGLKWKKCTCAEYHSEE
ncbi:MAG: preprotein translocase subunit SecA, partial [Pseudoflavonifractor sp.]